jgi:hypothetical protein
MSSLKAKHVQNLEKKKICGKKKALLRNGKATGKERADWTEKSLGPLGLTSGLSNRMKGSDLNVTGYQRTAFIFKDRKGKR